MIGFDSPECCYDQIKEYVLEKHGLYISQVKRKCGLDVGQNYNLSKKKMRKCHSARRKRKRRLWRR